MTLNVGGESVLGADDAAATSATLSLLLLLASLPSLMKTTAQEAMEQKAKGPGGVDADLPHDRPVAFGTACGDSH